MAQAAGTAGTADYKQVSANGARLAYVDQGQGEPVVFVHGGISDITIWEPILPRIAVGYRAIAYSRRYAWPNEPIPDGADDQMLPHVEDLAALIRALGLGRVHLVGNSWGGFVCLLTALRHPDLIRTLVVQEPPVIPLFVSTPPMPWQLAAVLLTRPRTGLAIMRMIFGGMLPAIRLLKRGRLEESVEHFARRVALGDAAYEAMSPEVRRHMALNAATHKAQFLGKGFPRFSPDDARSIQQPTLVMTGSESPEALRLLAARLRELLPAAEHVEIAGASHVMHQAQPAATADAILAFLRRHSG